MIVVDTSAAAFSSLQQVNEPSFFFLLLLSIPSSFSALSDRSSLISSIISRLIFSCLDYCAVVIGYFQPSTLEPYWQLQLLWSALLWNQLKVMLNPNPLAVGLRERNYGNFLRLSRKRTGYLSVAIITCIGLPVWFISFVYSSTIRLALLASGFRSHASLWEILYLKIETPWTLWAYIGQQFL